MMNTAIANNKYIVCYDFVTVLYIFFFKVAVSSLKPEMFYTQSSLVPHAWANQMHVKITLVPDCLFVPTL